MPGETFQTLKSKATQQAKQSGMSQSSAENYGSAMASQAAVQGNAGPDFLGSNTNQISNTVKEITNNMDFVTGSQGGPAGMTFTEAADANIMSPLEASQAQQAQMTNQNVLDQIAKRREVEKQVQEAGGVFNPNTGMIEYPQQGTGLGSLNLPKLNLTFGKPIKDLSPSDLKLILDQYKLYKEGMPNYFEGIPGGFNVAKGMFNSMSQGLERSGEFGGVEGSPTLEGLEKFIRDLDPDSNMLDAFKEAAPAEYLDSFGLPQTSAGLDFFANLSLDDDTVDKLTQQKIIEARERLAEDRQSQGLPMGQHPLMNIVANPQPGPIDDGSFQILENILTPTPQQTVRRPPGQTEFEQGGQPESMGTAQGIAPFDINQFYASLPSYSQQGVMSPSINPNIAGYYDNLRRFYG